LLFCGRTRDAGCNKERGVKGEKNIKISNPSLRGVQPLFGWTTWQSHLEKYFLKEKDDKMRFSHRKGRSSE
jgi:hypothetical protein